MSRISNDKKFQPSITRAGTAGGLASGDSAKIRSSNNRTTQSYIDEATANAMAILMSKMAALVPLTPYATEVSLKRVVRDDVIVNPIDSTGWRSPSVYSAQWWDDAVVIRKDGVYAFYSMRVERKYFGSYYYNCFIEGVIGVSDFEQALSLPLHSGPSSNIENRLLAGALSQLKDQKINLALALMEGKKSLQTLGSVITKLYAIINAIRKKDLGYLTDAFGFRTLNRNARGVYTKDASNLWLEAMYGVMPIIYDIYGICELFSSQLRTEGFRIVVRSKIEYIDTDTLVISPTSPLGVFVDGSIDVNHHVTQKVALWYELEAENLHLAEALGLTNPALLIWELTRLSFVVDWLIPIGSVLSGLTSDLGFKYIGGTHTYMSRANGHGLVGVNTAKPSQAQTLAINFSHTAKLKASSPTSTNGQMIRKVYKTSPKPGIFIKDPFSATHLITSMALLGSTFAKTKRLRV